MQFYKYFSVFLTWNCGSSSSSRAAALNYQRRGLMMDLYDARFMSNGSCGFVLKPAAMRDEVSYFSANSRDGLPAVAPQTLHVKVSPPFPPSQPKDPDFSCYRLLLLHTVTGKTSQHFVEPSHHENSEKLWKYSPFTPRSLMLNPIDIVVTRIRSQYVKCV